MTTGTLTTIDKLKIGDRCYAAGDKNKIVIQVRKQEGIKVIVSPDHSNETIAYYPSKKVVFLRHALEL